MSQFFYKGFDSLGGEESGMIEAASEPLAYDMLAGRGVIVSELGRAGALKQEQKSWYLRDISLSGGRDLQSEAEAAELLATLFEAGLTATAVFDVAAKTIRAPTAAKHFRKVESALQDGLPLSEAFGAPTSPFGDLFARFVSIGDKSNLAPVLLRELSTLLRKEFEARQKLRSALIYPIILILAAIAMLCLVVFFLAPNLMIVFEALDREPDGIIGALATLNVFISNHFELIGLAFLAALMAGLIALTHPKLAELRSQLWYQMPLLGQIARAQDLVSLCQFTALLIRSGAALSEALKDSTIGANRASPYPQLFAQAALDIEAGQAPQHVFEGENALPVSFKELYRVGAETNRVPDVLMVAAAAQQRAVDLKTQRALGLLTPVLTLIIGLSIGLLVYTIMGALLEVNELAF
jgi:type II secretory pathway component PulF